MWSWVRWQNDKISCFHVGKNTSDGRKRLENQMKFSSTCKLSEYPFTHTEEDIMADAPSFNNYWEKWQWGS